MCSKKLINIKSINDFIEVSDFQFSDFVDSNGKDRDWVCILKDVKELKLRGGVYIIVNKVTGKKYMGSSSDLYRRFRSHFSYSGPSNRITEVLKSKGELCKDIKQRECFSFNVFFSESYLEDERVLFSWLRKELEYNNRCPAKLGDRAVYAMSRWGDYKELLSIKEASDYYKVSEYCIKSKLDNSVYGNIFFSSEVRSAKYLKDYFYKVVCVNKKGSCLKSFVSIKEASNYYGISESTIYRSLRREVWVKKSDLKFNWVCSID